MPDVEQLDGDPAVAIGHRHRDSDGLGWPHPDGLIRLHQPVERVV
jgi:hypothetical protein